VNTAERPVTSAMQGHEPGKTLLVSPDSSLSGHRHLGIHLPNTAPKHDAGLSPLVWGTMPASLSLEGAGMRLCWNGVEHPAFWALDLAGHCAVGVSFFLLGDSVHGRHSGKRETTVLVPYVHMKLKCCTKLGSSDLCLFCAVNSFPVLS